MINLKSGSNTWGFNLLNTFYDRSYNTRITRDGATLDTGPMIAAWYTQSEQTRADLTAHLDLRYGDAHRETLDIFPATTATNRWLLFIHGGYWRGVTKESSSFLARPFVEAGYNVALIEYDLCPAVPISMIVAQCRRALAWVYHHAADYDLTCEEIIVAGHSAGGHLTAMMWATDWSRYQLPQGLIRGGIALSGLFDLDPIRYTNINEQVKLTDNDVITLSPARLVPLIAAPLVLAIGERESTEFHRQAQVLFGSHSWRDAVVASEVVVGAHHFDILTAFMDLDHPMWHVLRDNK